jgi:Spy/CpxP family protein refolding chaperone
MIMKKPTQRTPVLLAAGALLAAALIPIAAAQETGQPAPPAPPRMERHRPLAELNLTPDQLKALEALREGRREKAKAFRDDMAKLRAERNKIFKPEQLEKLKTMRSRLAARGALGRSRMGRGWRGRFYGPRAGLRPMLRRQALRHRMALRWWRWQRPSPDRTCPRPDVL